MEYCYLLLNMSMDNPDRFAYEESAPCPPDIRGAIACMEERMLDPQNNNASFPILLAVNLITVGQLQSLPQFEAWLREMDSKVYLMAVPLGFYGPDYVDRTRYPGKADSEPEYTLWAGVNGEAEAREMLARLGVTPHENMRRLHATGVIPLPE